MVDVSIIIPSRNEKYLQQTINSVLGAIEADTEIIVVLDGYWPYESIPDNPRVNIIHFSDARGQRHGINAAARIAKGKYLMKLDAHCAVGKGFDRILLEYAKPGWTQVPRMYNLDVDTWQPKKHKVTDYMYIGWNEKNEMRALYYTGKEYTRWHKRKEMIDETMACMGPGWFLSAEDFWKQDGCDEGHGGWGQQGIEVALKAWLSGGALMVNKYTWFAHWFRGGAGGFPYPISGRDVSIARKYSMDFWLNNRWDKATRKLSWLVNKFNPSGWEGRLIDDKVAEINGKLYYHLHKKRHEPYWRGTHIIKMPTDLLLYHKVIWENKPKWIIETGTKYGGSALFFQDQLDLIGEGGKVITIDKFPQVKNHDSRIIYLVGSSRDESIISKVKELIGNDTAMVSLDSDHGRVHVKWELHYYAPLVTLGQFLVVEDCYIDNLKPYYPLESRDWFLNKTKEGRNFEQTNLDSEFLVGVCVGGWLRRKQ